MKFPKLTKFQWFVHIASWLPLVKLIWDFVSGNLTVNPVQAATLRTGKLALSFLILALAATPMNTFFGFKPALKVRRALGLYAFLYAGLHFLIFVGLDYTFNLELLKGAILEKRYALVGFAAFLILLPLALTSTKGWMRRLGKNWKRLHRFIYLASVLVIIHYVWLVKTDIREPLLYGAAVLLLLVARLPVVRKYSSNLRIRMAVRQRRFTGNLLDSFKRRQATKFTNHGATNHGATNHGATNHGATNLRATKIE